jgi:hypothetical protein
MGQLNFKHSVFEGKATLSVETLQTIVNIINFSKLSWEREIMNDSAVSAD